MLECKIENVPMLMWRRESRGFILPSPVHGQHANESKGRASEYLLPNGRQKPVKWECTSHEQEVKARSLLDAGARFECEMLQTGQVSLTVEMLGNDGEPHTMAHEICENNPQVVDAVARLVERAHENFINQTPIQ